MFAFALFLGCQENDPAAPEAPGDGTVAQDIVPGNPDAPLTLRATCPDFQCAIDVDVTPNDADYEVCGIYTTTTPPPCFVSYSCGGGDDVGGEEDTFTGDDCFCAKMERKFLVRNISGSTITVNTGTGPETLLDGEFAVYETDTLCNISYICTE